MARASSPRAPEALLDLTGDLFAQGSLSHFGDAVLDAVERTVDFDYGAFQEIDVVDVEVGPTVQRPADMVGPRDVPQIVDHLKRDHPLIRHYARSPDSGSGPCPTS